MIERLRGAGAVLVGQTTASEFGGINCTYTRLHGATSNPYDLTRTPGGSSGGSAASVAGGLLPLCTGGDGGGSIRIPAGFTGLFGLKATFGRIPKGPHTEIEPLTAVIGCLTRSVRDAARYYDVCNGASEYDPFSLPRVEGWEAGLGTVDVRGLRVAVAIDLGAAVVAAAVRANVEAAADALIADAGLTKVDVPITLPRGGLEWAPWPARPSCWSAWGTAAPYLRERTHTWRSSAGRQHRHQPLRPREQPRTPRPSGANTSSSRRPGSSTRADPTPAPPTPTSPSPPPALADRGIDGVDLIAWPTASRWRWATTAALTILTNHHRQPGRRGHSGRPGRWPAGEHARSGRQLRRAAPAGAGLRQAEARAPMAARGAGGAGLTLAQPLMTVERREHRRLCRPTTGATATGAGGQRVAQEHLHLRAGRQSAHCVGHQDRDGLMGGEALQPARHGRHRDVGRSRTAASPGRPRNESPWAACGLPASRPRPMKSHTKAKP